MSQNTEDPTQKKETTDSVNCKNRKGPTQKSENERVKTRKARPKKGKD